METLKSLFPSLAVRELAKFVPDISRRDVSRGPAGVRAQVMQTLDTKLYFVPIKISDYLLSYYYQLNPELNGPQIVLKGPHYSFARP